MLDDITLTYMRKQTTFNNTNAYKYIKEKKRKEKKKQTKKYVRNKRVALKLFPEVFRMGDCEE